MWQGEVPFQRFAIISHLFHILNPHTLRRCKMKSVLWDMVFKQYALMVIWRTWSCPINNLNIVFLLVLFTASSVQPTWSDLCFAISSSVLWHLRFLLLLLYRGRLKSWDGSLCRRIYDVYSIPRWIMAQQISRNDQCQSQSSSLYDYGTGLGLCCVPLLSMSFVPLLLSLLVIYLVSQAVATERRLTMTRETWNWECSKRSSSLPKE